MVLGKVDKNLQNNESGPISQYHSQKLTQNGSNIWPDIIKLLEKNVGRISLTLVLAMIFLNITPKTTNDKTQKSTRDHIKLKRICTAKETINKMKRQSRMGRKNLQTIYQTN